MYRDIELFLHKFYFWGSYAEYLLQNRIKIAATSARVALLWGFSFLSAVPFTSCAAFAHCIASFANGLTCAASIKSVNVEYFNNERPAATLDYKSPVQYKTELGF